MRRSNQRDPMGPPSIYVLVSTLAPVRLALGHDAKAAPLADELARIEAPSGPTNAFNAACWLARCARLAVNDPNLTLDRQRSLADDYATRATVHLRTALSRGFNDAKLFAEDADLAPLRKRPDFPKFLPRSQ